MPTCDVALLLQVSGGLLLVAGEMRPVTCLQGQVGVCCIAPTLSLVMALVSGLVAASDL
jgi:hypothetical protein